MVIILWSSCCFFMMLITDQRPGDYPPFHFKLHHWLDDTLEVSKKLEACVFCMFHYVLAWHTNSHIILSSALHFTHMLQTSVNGGKSRSWSMMGKRKTNQSELVGILIRLLVNKKQISVDGKSSPLWLNQVNERRSNSWWELGGGYYGLRHYILCGES